jgi:hypothetical protein
MNSAGNPITGDSIGVAAIIGDPCGYYEWIEWTGTDVSDGTYSLVVPAGATYRVRSNNHGMFNYVNEWWSFDADPNDPSKPDCSQAAAIIANAGESCPNTNFKLDIGATISGTVKDSAGNPITEDSIGVAAITGDPCGDHQHVTGTQTNLSDGTYSITGIPAGTYYLQTWNNGTNYLNEWWNGDTEDPSDLDCSMANSITVVAGNPYPDKDFELDTGGSISGRVYQQDETTPVVNACINASLTAPEWTNVTGFCCTGPDGGYTIYGIPAGDVYLRTHADCQGVNPYLLDEWYAAGGSTPDGDEATAVTVTSGGSVTGKDFQLDIGATISGTVKDSSGNAITGDSIHISAFSGDPCGYYQWIEGTQTDPNNGTYSITGIPAGTYYLQTWNNGTYYVNEWWNGGSPDPSDPDCSLAQSITLASGQTVTGKDFQLDTGGSISGRVTTANGGDSIAGLWVQVYSGTCHQNDLGGVETNENGEYSFLGLPQGNFYVRACANCNQQNYVNEWWDNIADWNCDQAAAVEVTSGANTPNINFQLDLGGSISGHVYQQDETTPVANACINASLTAPEWTNVTGFCCTGPDGVYTIYGIPAGQDVYLRTHADCQGTNPYLLDEWYAADSSTPDGNQAEAVTVTPGGSVTGKDFQLDSGGSISGRVTTSGGDPIEGLWVQVFSGICYDDYLGEGGTNTNGDYTVSGLLPGDVYVRACADCNHQNYINEFWNDIPEWKSCELAAPVTVTGGEVTEDIDFSLDPGPRRFAWEPDIRVSGGIFGAGFDLLPGFNHLIEGATLTGPNGFYYDYDIEDDTFLWDNECSYLQMWWKDFPTTPIAYGLYTLTVFFLDGGEATYSKNLTEAHPTPVDFSTMSHTVNADGSMDFFWTPPSSDQYYQVRIHGLNDHDRYYRSSSHLVSETSLHVSANDLRCLKKGEQYYWYVRAYDDMPAYNAQENSDTKTFTYNPTALGGRTTWFEATSFNGNLSLYFNVRPGSRGDTVTEAIVTGPDSFTYTFHLTNDWFDMSTESRTLNGWSKTFTTPFSYGEYALDITFSDDHTEHLAYTLPDVDITPVDSATMSHEIHDDGAIFFSWTLPAGVTDQKYQVRIRSLDDAKEYVRSSSFTDGTQVYFSFWDLRALVHGETYQWFVRAYDENSTTMEQSGSLDFLYDPFSLIDSDNDGLPDNLENQICTDPNDADTDDDGILDGFEDVNHNGQQDEGETDPCNIDTDNDGIQDGTELGYTSGDIGPDTNAGVFQPDLDPSTTTDPLDPDTDGDGLLDGQEDSNHNGRVDEGETDPNRRQGKVLPGVLMLLLGD